MILDFEDFEIKILEMIATANKNLKNSKEYLVELKGRCNRYYQAGNQEDMELYPYNKIPYVETEIKCIEDQIRTYMTAIDIAKSLCY